MTVNREKAALRSAAICALATLVITAVWAMGWHLLYELPWPVTTKLHMFRVNIPIPFGGIPRWTDICFNPIWVGVLVYILRAKVPKNMLPILVAGLLFGSLFGLTNYFNPISLTTYVLFVFSIEFGLDVTSIFAEYYQGEDSLNALRHIRNFVMAGSVGIALALGIASYGALISIGLVFFFLAIQIGITLVTSIINVKASQDEPAGAMPRRGTLGNN